jgi:hypothetical protein
MLLNLNYFFIFQFISKFCRWRQNEIIFIENPLSQYSLSTLPSFYLRLSLFTFLYRFLYIFLSLHLSVSATMFFNLFISLSLCLLIILFLCFRLLYPSSSLLLSLHLFVCLRFNRIFPLHFLYFFICISITESLCLSISQSLNLFP